MPTSTALTDAPAAGSSALVRSADETQRLAWLQAVGRHDERAFAALYDALSAQLLREALCLLGDAAAAEALVEEAFWQVWRQARRHDAAAGSVLDWIGSLLRATNTPSGAAR